MLVLLPHSASVIYVQQSASLQTLHLQLIWPYIISYWQELDHVVEELEKIAVVKLLQHRSIISLIGNVLRSSLILEKVLHLVSPLNYSWFLFV